MSLGRGRPLSSAMFRLQSRPLLFPFTFGSTAATCLLVWVSACSSSDGSENDGSGAASSTGGASAGTNIGPAKGGSLPSTGSAGSGVVSTAGSATAGGATDGACALTQERIRITEVDVGVSVVN